MKYQIVWILFFFTISCNNSTQSDPIKAASRFSKEYLDCLRIIETPRSKIINFKLINDSCYFIQWGNRTNLKTLKDTFIMNNHEAWIPRLITESQDYLVMRSSCGNPCWIGYFLPLDNSIEPTIINEYLGFDLENDLVAYPEEDSNAIEILNIKTKQKELHVIRGCNSAFIGYCIDSLVIRNKTLIYRYPSELMKGNVNSKVIIEKIGV